MQSTNNELLSTYLCVTYRHESVLVEKRQQRDGKSKQVEVYRTACPSGDASCSAEKEINHKINSPKAQKNVLIFWQNVHTYLLHQSEICFFLYCLKTRKKCFYLKYSF